MSAPLRILHVVAGLEPHHGGPSYTVPRLAQAQAALGAQVALASVAAPDAPTTDREELGVRVIRAAQTAAGAPLLSRLRLSRDLDRALAAVAPQVDVVHVHGLWLWPTLAAAAAARRVGAPLILSPRGMLAPEALAISPRRKSLFHQALQASALRDLACIHATCRQEADEAQAFGFAAPVALAPNGVDLAALSTPRPRPENDQREALYLGRLHPKKALDVLIEAWACTPETLRDGWRLRLVGPSDDGYPARLIALATMLGVKDSVSLEPPLYGPEKLTALRRADVFVSPSPNENFGVATAEALAAETPAIVSRGAPWAALETERCGWWTPPGREPFAAALAEALTTPRKALEAMGVQGRAHVARACDWEAIAARLIDAARWLRDGGPQAASAPPAAILPETIPAAAGPASPRGAAAPVWAAAATASRKALRVFNQGARS